MIDPKPMDVLLGFNVPVLSPFCPTIFFFFMWIQHVYAFFEMTQWRIATFMVWISPTMLERLVQTYVLSHLASCENIFQLILSRTTPWLFNYGDRI